MFAFLIGLFKSIAEVLVAAAGAVGAARALGREIGWA